MKEYFLDMAGIEPYLSWGLDEHKWEVQNTPFGSGEVFGSYANSLWEETQDPWDDQAMFFGTGIRTDVYSLNDSVRAGLEAQGYHGSLNKMIREFAIETIGGVASLDFDDVKTVWDQVPNSWNGIGVTDAIWDVVDIPWELEDDYLMGDVSDIPPISINAAWRFLVNRVSGDVGESIGGVTSQALDDTLFNDMGYTWEQEARVWDYIG